MANLPSKKSGNNLFGFHFGHTYTNGMTSDDMALVREYAQSNSEKAFAALVSRHVNLVYSVALRQVRDSHLAEEVTQGVFIILAGKAKSLSPKTILSGWLCRTARYVSANTLSIQRRRQSREQEAHMQSILNEPDSDVWTQLAPHLDEALNSLGEKEHDAVVLRFFDGNELKQVGAAMGTSEDAARMKVNRGLEKLRGFFTKRGITLSTTVIAGAIAVNSVQVAPAGIAATITAAALAGTTIAVTTTIATTMNWLNLKSFVAIFAAALAAGTGTHLVQKRESNRLRAEQQNILGQQETLSSQRDAALTVAAENAAELERLQNDKNELLRLRGEIGLLRGQAKELETLKQINQQLAETLATRNAQLAQKATTNTYADATQFPISRNDISGTAMRAARELDSSDPSQQSDKHYAIVLTLTSAKANEFLEFKQTHLNQAIQMLVGTNIAKEPAILSGNKVSSIQVYFNSSKEAVEFADAIANDGR